MSIRSILAGGGENVPHRFPSLPAARLPAMIGNSVMHWVAMVSQPVSLVRSMRAIPTLSVNQMLWSGPTVMANGTWLGVGGLYSVMQMVGVEAQPVSFVGSRRPTLPPNPSVNQIVPSGAMTRLYGSVPDAVLGIWYSV